jgi:hypothetical protein
MNELKPEDVMRVLAWYEVVGKNVGNVTVPYDELKAIAELLREKDARIEQLLGDIRATVELANKGAEEKDAEIERLTAYNANLICANTDITNRHKDYVDEAERIARRDAITEFAERLKGKTIFLKDHAGNIGVVVRFSEIDKIAKEMRGESDGRKEI